MQFLLLLSCLLQGGSTEVSGPDREFLAACRRVGERFRDAVNNRDPAVFRETFSPTLKEISDLDAVCSLIDKFRQSRGRVLLVKQIRRSRSLGRVHIAAERSPSILNLDFDANGGVAHFDIESESPPPPPQHARGEAFLDLPVRSEWLITAGGESEATNHHMSLNTKVAWCAVDFAREGGEESLSLFKEDGVDNEDFYAFGEDVLAAASGKVVTVVDGVPDNEPGFPSQLFGAGNSVVIKHDDFTFTQYAHLKRGSIRVKVGDDIKAGQVVAQCGNSGNSPGPHLHFGLMNSANPCFAVGQPILFRDVAVASVNGKEVVEHYTPYPGDRIRSRGGPPAAEVGAPTEVEPGQDSPRVAPVFAQPPMALEELQDSCRAIGLRFTEAINQGKLKEFHASFADDFKREFDLDKLAAYIDDLREAYGKIVKSWFLAFHQTQGDFEYRAERGAMYVTFILRPDGSLGGFDSYVLPAIPIPAGNSVSLLLPVRGQWAVRWGGSDPNGNPHMTQNDIERHAVDFADPGDEEIHFHNLLRNEDFAAFGREILAAAPGVVVMAVDGNQDNPPGHADPTTAIGNAILIQHAEQEFALYGHLQRGSVAVKVGDQIQVGQVIARCGNSGASMRPHLQFGMVNDADPSFATGFPFTFRDVIVTRDGRDETKDVYEPRAGDQVRAR